MEIAPHMKAQLISNILENIDLMVCDMAGTTVQEGGLVYKILRQSMNDANLGVSEEAMHAWHGAKKEAVIEHFARKKGIPEHELEAKIFDVADVYTAAIDKAYFDEASAISHIEIDLASFFRRLKLAGVKIALDTGYPPNIQ